MATHNLTSRNLPFTSWLTFFLESYSSAASHKFGASWWQFISLHATDAALHVLASVVFRNRSKASSAFFLTIGWSLLSIRLRMAAAALACLPMTALLYYLPQFWIFPETSKIMQFSWLAATVILSMLTFFASAWVLGERKLFKKR